MDLLTKASDMHYRSNIFLKNNIIDLVLQPFYNISDQLLHWKY